MPDRLPIDVNVIGYWGFDESLETDVAFDESTNLNALTVTSSPSVVLGRIGNARQFNGTTTFAEPVGVSTQFRLLGDAAFIGWAKLDSYNSGGSLLRTLVSCGTAAGNILYQVAVDSAGRLVYKHDSAGGVVIARTAVASIKTGQIYSIVLRRAASGGNQTIEFYLDNVLKPIVDVTVNAVPSAMPVPVPAANASAVLSIGKSRKDADSSFWQGLLDEISIHDTARSFQPYLRQAYYRISLSNDVNRLTYFNTIVSVSSYEMGGGVRWWCYESDKDLYVVKESPFGFFGPETRLTTPGGGAATKAEDPELIYDPVTDTLLVLFVAGNRIYKLTAQSTDDPATINMPFTADAGSIIKSVDNADGGAFGHGGSQRAPVPEDITYVNRSPVKVFHTEPTYDLGFGGSQTPDVIMPRVPPAFAEFLTRPTVGLGIVVGPQSTRVGSFRIYRMSGGASSVIGTAPLLPEGMFFLAFPTAPVYGDVFYAEALFRNGVSTGVFSNAIRYKNNDVILLGNTLTMGQESDASETMSAGFGGGQQNNFDLIVYVNRTPVKISGEDSPSFNIGFGGSQSGIITSTGSNRPGTLAILVNL